MLKYRNKKTGKIYRWLAAGTDCTDNVNRSVAIYCPDDNGHEIYVRERTEFEEKFDPITTGA